MTEELKKQGIADDAAVAETVEETGATPGLDEAAKAAEREARRQALYEENERAEDERARAEAERMRDVDDEVAGRNFGNADSCRRANGIRGFGNTLPKSSYIFCDVGNEKLFYGRGRCTGCLCYCLDEVKYAARTKKVRFLGRSEEASCRERV